MTQTIEIIGGGSGGTIDIVGGGERRATISVTGSGAVPVPQYSGPYEFTPGDETQTVQIARKMATQNIKINPVPSNYGKISWNGSVLTVF